MLTSAKQALPALGLLSQWAMDVAFPPRCPACHVQVSAQHNFCSPCFDALKQIAAPHCACCGIPFAFDMGADAKCPECLSETPSFDSCRAPLVYDETSAPIIRSLKFNDRYTGLERATRMMLASLGTLRDEVELVVPVPLHWRRLMTRYYNQSALLGFAIARELALPCAPQALRRARHTTPQMRLTRKERLQNVRNAFAVPENAKEGLQGKCVLLVDDVVTTGATVSACASMLKKAGAAQVHVLALARTVKS